MLRVVVPLVVAFAALASAADDPTVFKSDVAMTRVDAQVVDRDGRTVTGLQLRDFVLRLDGRPVPIRNFASENMPIDIVLLLDVSGSMEPHVQRIASAAHEALNVLAEKDRVAVMVFDNYARVRLPFRSSHSEVTAELDRLLRSERFNGGTRITHALLSAASYLERQARPEARRAIVILTDDETQDEENEPKVQAALDRANAVLSFLQAPYEPPTLTRGGRRGTWGGGGGGWPGGGWPGGGGVGFPGGGPWGRGGPGGYGGDPSHSAGTADISRDSGGDVMQVDESSALEDTLQRLRQRYALYFYLPEGTKADQISVRLDLAQNASILHPNAEIRYRRVHMSGPDAGERLGPAAVSHVPATTPVDEPTPPEVQPTSTSRGRRVAVNEDSGPHVNTIDTNSDKSSQQAAPPKQAPAPTTQAPQNGGWPRVNPQNPPF